jgi:hypothetical protein
MTGVTLINRTRLKLRDVETDVSQGEFWTDDEILAVLNACQLSFINFCLNHNLYQELFLLMTSVDVSGRWDNLPLDYLHYQSGRVEGKPAKIFLGGDGFGFLNSNLEAFIIFNNLVSVRDGTSFGTGTLYYYKVPSQIDAGTFADCFSWEAYRLISDYAVTLLGMKEIQTSRDFKTKKRLVEELAVNPPIFANYLRDKESIIKQKLQNE